MNNEQLMQHMSCGILLLRDDAEMTIISANDFFRTTYGSHIAGQPGGNGVRALKDMLKPDDFAGVRDDSHKKIQNGTNRFEYEAKAFKNDGESLWVLLNLTYCPDDNQLVCVVTDIDCLKRREEHVVENLKHSGIIIQQAGIFPGRYHIPSRTMFYTPEAAALLGVDAVQLNFPRGYVAQGLAASDPDKFIAFYDRICRGGHIPKSSVEIRTSNGEVRLFNRHVTILNEENGNPLNAIVSLIDITEQREQRLAYEKWLHTCKSLKADSIHYYDYNLTSDVLESIDGNSPSIYPDQNERSFSGVAAYVAESIVHPDDKEEYLRVFSRESLMDRFARGELEIHTAHRRLKPDGTYMKARGIIQLFADPFNGDILCFVLIKNMDDALAQLKDETQTEVLGLISDSVPGGIVFSYDTPGYPFYFITNSMSEFLGYPREELEKRSRGLMINFVHPEEREHVAEAINQAIKNGEGFEVRHRVLRRDGDTGWVLLRGRKVRDDDGRDFIISIYINVTKLVILQEELKVHTEVLKEKNSRLEALTENVPGGVSVMKLDEERTLIYANHNFYELYGYSPEQAKDELNNQWFSRIHPDDMAISNEIILNALKNDESRFEFERRSLRRDGQVIWVMVCGSFIKKDDEIYIYCVTLDVTARKLYEETKARHEQALKEAAAAAEEATRMKSEFLANMSHEIRTPMNGVVGLAEIVLDDEGLSPRTRDFIEKIRVSAQSLLEIINAILDISKIEAGKMELEETAFDLHDVFKQCEAISSVKTMEKGLLLFFYSEPHIGRLLVGDPTKLRQILLNLLSNSIKFTNKGIVKLLTTVENVDADAVSICFEVKDSGIGMDAEQIRKIFDPFSQADSSTTRKYGGTGLGLAISKNMIELMGGRLIVDSILGMGSKFSFTLTFKTVPVPAKRPERPALAGNEKPIFTGEVLVFEDNAINQQVITEQLARVGLGVTMAENGKVGVDIMKECIEKGKKFALILMDVHMPVMDGLDATRELLEMGVQTPIVALTANAMVSDRARYLACGMSDYITKPFKSEELWNCLLKYLMPTGFAPLGKSSAAPGRLIDDEKLFERIRNDFRKDNRDAFAKMDEALKSGDAKRAHLMAHTMKSVTALIGAERLSGLARQIEDTLAEDKIEVPEALMAAFKNELNAVLDKLGAERGNGAANSATWIDIDKTKALALLDRLEPLLRKGDADSVDQVDAINEILTPALEYGGILAGQVEDYDFEPALETVNRIRKSIC